MIENLISIIIPIYNREDSLLNCVNSVLSQTYQNIEIILVNDGSNDGSAVICDKIQKQYQRVTTIHKLNEGVSVARNEGLKYAKGKFIQFIDADDYIDEKMCEKLIYAILNSNSDLAICGYKKNSGNIKEIFYENKILKAIPFLSKALDI